MITAYKQAKWHDDYNMIWTKSKTGQAFCTGKIEAKKKKNDEGEIEQEQANQQHVIDERI